MNIWKYLHTWGIQILVTSLKLCTLRYAIFGHPPWNYELWGKAIYVSTTVRFCCWLFASLYSLISIRQNYNFETLNLIWHEIVCWFLKIYQDLKSFAAQEHRIVFVLTFRCEKQFDVPNMQEQSKMGKKIRNQQTNIRHLMA